MLYLINDTVVSATNVKKALDTYSKENTFDGDINIKLLGSEILGLASDYLVTGNGNVYIDDVKVTEMLNGNCYRGGGMILGTYAHITTDAVMIRCHGTIEVDSGKIRKING